MQETTAQEDDEQSHSPNNSSGVQMTGHSKP